MITEILDVPGAVPVVELGVGNTLIPTGQGRWDVSLWDEPTATWSGIEPTWIDISCEVHEIEIEYGRDRSMETWAVGSCMVTLDNATGWADMGQGPPPAPFALSVRPGRQLRVGMALDGGPVRWLWRGFIDDAEPTYEAQESDIVTLACIDAKGEAGKVDIGRVDPAVGANESCATRIHRILNLAGWETKWRQITATGVTMLATELGGRAVDLLDVTADSAGGAIFGDARGYVVFKPRDWQTFSPGKPPDGTIGNVDPYVPGYWVPGTPAVPYVPGYLTPTVGTVTTPDPGPPPGQCTWVFKIRGPSGTGCIAAQYESVNTSSWVFNRNAAGAGQITLTVTPTGSQANGVSRIVNGGTPTSGDEWLALSRIDDGSTFSTRLHRSIDQGATWTVVATSATVASVAAADVSTVIRVGAFNAGAGQPFAGRIYSVELRTGLDPAAGSVLWRFDADDYPGGGATSYTDPRGRDWTLTAAAAITSKIPEVPEGPPVWVPSSGDTCPVGWERAFRRVDIATRTVVGRTDEVTRQFDDLPNQSLYGIETLERTDLICAQVAQLDVLGQRWLRVASADYMPRVAAVTINAAESIEARDLAYSVDPTKPSRYRCRHQRDGEIVFDAEFFATGVRHVISRDGWECRIALDDAAPYVAIGGRWDQGCWDQALWAGTPAVREMEPA